VYLEGLQPGTTYHYRVVATNVDGTTYGEDQTFTTPGYLELIATGVIQGYRRLPRSRSRWKMCALTQNSSLLLMEIPQACRVLSRS
jgi:hypothetical protein